jgi:hypothetical protein
MVGMHGWKSAFRIAGLASLLVLLLAEFPSRLQEVLVVREYGLKPTESVHVPRWWPFEHHSIDYSKEYGWCGSD